MFKQASFGEEIYQSMQKNLVSNQLEDKHGFNKLAKAVDLLNLAADIFDQAGMRKEALETTKVLNSLAVDQLISKSFSISDLIDKIDVLGIDEKDLHSMLQYSTPAQLVNLAKKISSVIKGESSLSEILDKTLDEHDLSDPEVRSGFVDKIITALKVAKLFV